ncbi:hypothetical protein ALC57_06124 [Trachymyrmex cornetzi]|uniref:Endonuclease/exonuclease/phosphatase domain-containing protein n=1 Tax=Trachymyrmex cornetzi TaxID=471704 RepID=A0A195E8G8_9HYME|nr:hypothetical protein ALC57_06124 [Trachymyrmex cornetzi]
MPNVFRSSTFHVGHINVKSLVPHFTLLKDLLSYRHFDVLAVGETWLHDSVDSFSISLPGFTLFRSDRAEGRGGDVALYIDGALLISQIDFDVSPSDVRVDLEAFVQLMSKRIATICVYRPPRSNAADFRYIEFCLLAVACSSDVIICMDDLNVNLLNPSDPNSQHLHFLLSHFSLSQLIHDPTRVTSNTSSIIDLIMISSSVHVIESSVCFDIPISDHFVVHAVLHLDRSRKCSHISLSRNLRSIDSSCLDFELARVDCSPLYCESHVDEKVTYFTSSLTSVFDRLVPLAYKHQARPPAP